MYLANVNVQSLIVVFILTLVRITPVLCFKSINPLSMLPNYIKLMVTLVITSLISATVQHDEVLLMKISQLTNEELVSSILIEFFIGLVFWFSLIASYGAVMTMLKLLDMQVGFNPMGIFNPSTQDSDPILARVILIFVFILFFIIDFHYALIEFLTSSLTVYPILSGIGSWSINSLVAIFSTQFILAILIVAPVVMAIFWIEMVFGMCNKMMPQINIYFVGQPLKILVALIILSASSKHVLDIAQRIFQSIIEYNFSLI